MTREEAIKSALKYLVHKQQEQGSWGYADNDNINKVPWDEALEWIDKQPCGDLISRQAVIDTIETDCSWDIFNEWGSRTPAGECIINAIKSVPSVEPESCGDCISRQAAIDEIEWEEEYGRIDTSKAIDCLKKLPSVEPERKTGKWIVYEDCEGKTRTCTCNLCGYETGEYTWVNPNYCENCGAKMEVDG